MNRAVDELKKEIAAAGGNESHVARELKTDQSYLNRVMREKRSPGLKFRKKCKERYGISMDAWEEPPGEDEEELAAP